MTTREFPWTPFPAPQLAALEERWFKLPRASYKKNEALAFSGEVPAQTQVEIVVTPEKDFTCSNVALDPAIEQCSVIAVKIAGHDVLVPAHTHVPLGTTHIEQGCTREPIVVVVRNDSKTTAHVMGKISGGVSDRLMSLLPMAIYLDSKIDLLGMRIHSLDVGIDPVPKMLPGGIRRFVLPSGSGWVSDSSCIELLLRSASEDAMTVKLVISALIEADA